MYLDRERNRLWEKFRKMSPATSLVEYQALNAKAQALDDLESELKAYVQTWQDEQIKEWRKEETGGRDPQDG